MNAKRNLTIAGLAALLAVPAFSATHGTHIHIPQITDNLTINAHADSTSQFRPVTPAKSYWGHWAGNQTDRGQGHNYSVYIGPHSSYYHSTNDDQGPTTITTPGSYKHDLPLHPSYVAWVGKIKAANPNYFRLINNNTLAYQEDTTVWYLHRVHKPKPNPSPTPNPSPSPSPTPTPDNGGNGSNIGNVTNTGYTSQQSAELGSTSNLISNTGALTNTSSATSNQKLPQTGEINHKTDELVSSIMLGFAATTMAGASLELKKHRK